MQFFHQTDLLVHHWHASKLTSRLFVAALLVFVPAMCGELGSLDGLAWCRKN